MKQSNMFLSALLLLLYFTTNTVYAGINPSVASRRPSFQSSTVNGQGADKCNDDNFSNYCQTEDDKFNWWCVKLDSVLDFQLIWLNNRVTMYGDYLHRIKGFEIRLLGEKGECNKAAAEEARVCYKDTSTRGTNYYLIKNCNQGGLFQGRYVFVVLRNEILNFGELKVYGFPNLLAGRPVAVSSTSGTGAASNGYDSNIDTNVVTNSGSLEWWCVQLDGVYDFKNFQLYNTVDRSSDIQGFEIRLSYDGACDEATARRAGVCYKDNSAPQAQYTYFGCNRPVFFAARYVFLVQQNKRLRFSEMQIHGLKNLARNKPTGSSSVLPGGFESWKVTDGSLDTLSRTNVSQVEWICVDLEDIYDLKDLRVYNAIDNTKSKLQGYRTWFLLDGGCSSEGFKRSLLCDYDVSPPQDQYIRHICQWNTSAIFSARSIYVVVQTNKGVNLREIQAFGSVPANRALGQPTLMSTTEDNFPGKQANDGSLKSISKTKSGSNQWWCVTMKTIYNFTDIKIHNRGDCCKEKMKNFEIRILERGGCSQESLSRAKTCYKEPGTVKDVYHISSCNNGGSFAGQAVFIVNTNSQQLAIRHVEIYGPAFYEVVEVAKRKPAFASGYTVGKGPGNGNDGNIKTFVQTNSGNSEWWCVDLFNQHELFRLQIMNGDTQGRRKLSGFEVKLHPYWGCDRITYQKSTLCYTHRSAASNEYLIHECDDVKTRFFARSVFIRSTQSYFIEFAEIRILANATHPMYNTALNRPSASSSVANGGVALRGNDGNQNTQLQTNQEDPAWWCVKLPNVYDFMKLAFYPADSSPDTGIEVKLSNFLGCSAEGLHKANRCHIGTIKGGQVHFVFACNLGGQIRGRYVYVKTVSSGSIQLKEFQALGAIRYPLPNVALNKGTLQSSTDGLTSSLAVDGNPATCSRTLVEDEPWFCVDLDKEYVLDSVGVWRSDLGDYEMRLDQTDFCHHKGFESAKPCYRGSDDVVGKCNQVNSGPFSARSVYITFRKRSLHVCDLIVRPVTGKGSGCTLDWEGLY